MLTLGIDTSAVTASAALVRDGEVLCEFSLTGGLTHSEHLVPMIENCLEYSRVSPRDIDVFAVSAGPGSFTGLRIGVSTVKGLAFAENKPCVGVSTLEALAMRLSDCEGVVCPVMDARRGEFYNALFRVSKKGMIRLCPDRAVPAAELEKELEAYENVVVNGDGAKKLISLFTRPVATLAHASLIRQSAAEVALIGEREHKQGKSVSSFALSPVYLRLPQAERELLNQNKTHKEKENDRNRM